MDRPQQARVGIATAQFDPRGSQPVAIAGAGEDPRGHEGEVAGQPQIGLATRAQRAVGNAAQLDIGEREGQRPPRCRLARISPSPQSRAILGKPGPCGFPGCALLEGKSHPRRHRHRLGAQVDLQRQRHQFGEPVGAQIEFAVESGGIAGGKHQLPATGAHDPFAQVDRDHIVLVQHPARRISAIVADHDRQVEQPRQFAERQKSAGPGAIGGDRVAHLAQRRIDREDQLVIGGERSGGHESDRGCGGGRGESGRRNRRSGTRRPRPRRPDPGSGKPHVPHRQFRHCHRRMPGHGPGRLRLGAGRGLRNQPGQVFRLRPGCAAGGIGCRFRCRRDGSGQPDRFPRDHLGPASRRSRCQTLRFDRKRHGPEARGRHRLDRIFPHRPGGGGAPTGRRLRIIAREQQRCPDQRRTQRRRRPSLAAFPAASAAASLPPPGAGHGTMKSCRANTLPGATSSSV